MRAGCLVPVFLNLGDIELQNYMLVEKVKHTFENNSHFMDLTLVDGDEFASYSSSSYSSGNTNNKDEKKNGPAQSIMKKIQVKKFLLYLLHIIQETMQWKVEKQIAMESHLM